MRQTRMAREGGMGRIYEYALWELKVNGMPVVISRIYRGDSYYSTRTPVTSPSSRMMTGWWTR